MCDHPNLEWDWGGARPSLKRVAIPGGCPDCGAEIERIYGFVGLHRR